MSEVRQVQIKGTAITDYTKERKTRKRKSQDGGFDVPNPADQIVPTTQNLSRVRNFVSKMNGGSGNAVQGAAGGGSTNAGAVPPLPKLPELTPPPAESQAKVPANPVTMQGGGKKTKLILEKKKSMKKLHLAPASVSNSHSGKRSLAKTRKIRVNLSGMKKRLTRAKQIHGDSRQKDISEIKKTLHDAKLLKPRASDKVDTPEYDLLLRKTYENYMLLRNRAL
jgi:hypothetical protein